MEKEPGMKIWCAAGVDRSGGRTQDGGDASVFSKEGAESKAAATTEEEPDGDSVSKLDRELTESRRLAEEAAEADQNLSSHVWICTSTHAISKASCEEG